jgi:acetyltransferase-like isoleucine patch superfamily enzyme
MDGKMPYVEGHVQIHVGDGVVFGGNVSIASGRMFDEPRLIIGDRVGIGWGTHITVSREVIIEDDVWLPWDCSISDTDGHPREADRRIAKLPPDPKDIRPVRICKRAWIGNGAHIMKGVTIGEGAIIGAGSVVISNIPPYALAMGNPAEVILKNFGLPSTANGKTPVE